MESIILWILSIVLFIVVIYSIIMIPLFVKKDEESKKQIENIDVVRKALLTKYKI